MKRSFRQVNVFSADPLCGNPLAVVHSADGLTEQQMAAFARWTNLSESAYLLNPTDDAADYRSAYSHLAASCPLQGTRRLGPVTPGLLPAAHHATAGSSFNSARSGWSASVARAHGSSSPRHPCGERVRWSPRSSLGYARR